MADAFDELWASMESGKQPFEDTPTYTSRKAGEISALAKKFDSTNSRIEISAQPNQYDADRKAWVVPFATSWLNVASSDAFSSFETFSKSFDKSNLAKEVRIGPFAFIRGISLPRETIKSPLGLAALTRAYGYIVIGGKRIITDSIEYRDGKYFLVIPMPIEEAKKNAKGISVSILSQITFPYAVRETEHLGGNAAVGRLLSGKAANDPVALEMTERHLFAVELTGFIIHTSSGDTSISQPTAGTLTPPEVKVLQLPTFSLVDTNPAEIEPKVYGRGEQYLRRGVCYAQLVSTATIGTNPDDIDNSVVKAAKSIGAEMVLLSQLRSGERWDTNAVPANTIPETDYRDQSSLFGLACKYPKASLGIAFKEDPYYDVPSIIVTAVTPGSPADKIGITAGEKIFSLNGKMWTKKIPQTLDIEVLMKSPGEKVDVRWRSSTGAEKRATATLMAPPRD